MKVLLAFFVALQALQTEWIVREWFNEAVNVFKFSNENWISFSEAVDAVSKEGLI